MTPADMLSKSKSYIKSLAADCFIHDHIMTQLITVHLQLFNLPIISSLAPFPQEDQTLLAALKRNFAMNSSLRQGSEYLLREELCRRSFFW